MRRKLLKVWYVVLIFSVLELVFYGITGYVSYYYRTAVVNSFNEHAQTLHDVEIQIPYAEMINRYGRAVGINPQVIAGVIKTESSFEPRALSPAGAYGLMQIMPNTWRQVNKSINVCAGRHTGECSSECYYNAELNIHIGTNYLSQLLRKYQGNMVLALAAYNAGPGAVDRYGGIPPYDETIKYTESVIQNYYSLQSKNMLYTSIARSEQWGKAHQFIGGSIIITGALLIFIVWRLVKYQSSWYWR